MYSRGRSLEPSCKAKQQRRHNKHIEANHRPRLQIIGENKCCTVVMLEKRRHPLRGSVVPALLLLLGSCALQSRAAAFPDWTDCPAVCRCKWTLGKKSALCPDAGLTSLPASLDPDMQILDLSGNRIPSLQSEVFKRAGLVNLQRVFLRNAGIHKIHGDTFLDLGILIEVDLSDNYLRTLEPDTFNGNERLRILILSGNPLGTLRSHQFPVLQHLRNLELQRCSLTQIHAQALVHLSGLESLKLDDNQLKYLETPVISGLPRLMTLTLEGNKWSCDCRLRGFRSWIIPTDGVPRKLYGTSQICWEPARLQSRHWESVKPTEFACGPEVFVLANTIQEEANGNLSLACLAANGDPEPEVWWQFNGGTLNLTRVEQTFSGYSTSNDISTASRFNERWSNLTIYNASDGDAGEYACFAKNVAGIAKDTVNIVVPRVFSSPTLSQTDNWFLWVSLAGGGAAALCASISAVILLLCLGGSVRRKRRREKVKLQSSASFGDQEKKLLDLSVTTTTGGSANGNDRSSSAHGSIAETCSPAGDLELTERGSFCDPIGAAASVTVERFIPESSIPSGIRAIPCTNIFPPPPPEFTTGVLPAGIFGNIFISVSLPQDGERCYPDLLDIPVHATAGITDKFLHNPRASSSMISTFATLPRRSLRTSDLGSPYDNMGPRVTATGSSTFSLTDDLSPPPPPRIIKPPIEFVSL